MPSAHRTGLLHRFRVLALGFLVCSGLGCTETTSNMLGWYVTRKLDQTFDLDRAQKAAVRERVDAQLLSLRSHDLPKLLHLMRSVRDAIDQDDVEARYEALEQSVDKLLERVAQAVIPDLAALIDMLSAPQIAHFERRMQDYLEEIYADQHMPPSERRKERSEALLSGLKKATGPLSAAQAETILAVARTLPDDRAERYRDEKARLAAAVRFFDSQPGRDAIAAELTRLWRTRHDSGIGATERKAAQRTLLLSIDKTLTRKQRTHAVERLNNQIRALKRFVIPRAE